MKLLLTFIVLNIVNVILQTVRSICTVKCGRMVASLVNAIAYGLYTVVIVYTNADLALWVKVVIVAIANLIGVYVVKLLEEKKRKDKLWKVEATVKDEVFEKNKNFFENFDVPYNYTTVNNGYKLVNFYCATQKDSATVKAILEHLHAKFFVSETKDL